MKGTGKRVLLGMSGGVDSSVTGHILKQQGYDVIGVTMKVWPQDCITRAEDKCCGPSAIADARGVAHKLGIPHYVVDEADQFEKIVIGYFADEYRAGRTPNPCVMCNERLKFGNLWEKAKALGAEFIATGHYAIIEHSEAGARLRKGRDDRKDQAYFLFSLRQEQLSRALTPLGGMTKPEIRAAADAITPPDRAGDFAQAMMDLWGSWRAMWAPPPGKGEITAAAPAWAYRIFTVASIGLSGSPAIQFTRSTSNSLRNNSSSPPTITREEAGSISTTYMGFA